jgi:predicted site-specific integrase-resolvase
MNFGYARVSTKDQNLDLQIDALKKSGCTEVYSEKVSGKKVNRPQSRMYSPRNSRLVFFPVFGLKTGG